MTGHIVTRSCAFGNPLKPQTPIKLGLAVLASLFLLAACAAGPSPNGGFGDPNPSSESADH